MTPLRRTSLALALAAALVLIGSSAGFSAVTADRPVSVSIVDDDAAYLGVESAGSELTVSNRFAEPITDLRVRVAGQEVYVSTPVPPGESVPVDACSVLDEGGETGVLVDASTASASADLTRTYDLTCAADSADYNVSFKGGGNVHVEGPYPVDVTVHFASGDDEKVTLEQKNVRNAVDSEDCITAITIGGDRFENQKDCKNGESEGQPAGGAPPAVQNGIRYEEDSLDASGSALQFSFTNVGDDKARLNEGFSVQSKVNGANVVWNDDASRRDSHEVDVSVSGGEKGGHAQNEIPQNTDLNDAFSADGSNIYLDDQPVINSDSTATVWVGQFGKVAGKKFKPHEFDDFERTSDSGSWDLKVTMAFQDGDTLTYYFVED